VGDWLNDLEATYFRGRGSNGRARTAFSRYPTRICTGSANSRSSIRVLPAPVPSNDALVYSNTAPFRKRTSLAWTRPVAAWMATSPRSRSSCAFNSKRRRILVGGPHVSREGRLVGGSIPPGCAGVVLGLAVGRLGHSPSNRPRRLLVSGAGGCCPHRSAHVPLDRVNDTHESEAPGAQITLAVHQLANAASPIHQPRVRHRVGQSPQS
jgi:hypothetical protein